MITEAFKIDFVKKLAKGMYIDDKTEKFQFSDGVSGCGRRKFLGIISNNVKGVLLLLVKSAASSQDTCVAHKAKEALRRGHAEDRWFDKKQFNGVECLLALCIPDEGDSFLG